MTTLKKHLNHIIDGTYAALIDGDFVAQPSDNIGEDFQIHMSYDGDMSYFSVLDFSKDKSIFNEYNHLVNGNKVLHFTLDKEKTLFSNSLYVLAEAIRRDNELGKLQLQRIKEYSRSETAIAFDWMIENAHKFETLTEESYQRVQDDNDGDKDSAITITLKNNEIEVHANCGDSFRFRTSCGGGKSLRVRNALIYLAYVSQKLESNSKLG
jgi:hypothetical protein